VFENTEKRSASPSTDAGNFREKTSSLRFSVTVSDLTRRDQDLRMMQGDDTKRSVDDGEDKFVIPNKQALQLRTGRTSFI
jgi:hypothetical protein